MNKKNLKKIFFPLKTGRNRFFVRNGTVSSPLNPMVCMVCFEPIRAISDLLRGFRSHDNDCHLNGPSGSCYHAILKISFFGQKLHNETISKLNINKFNNFTAIYKLL